MAWHLPRFGSSVLLGTVLLVGPSLAMDRPLTPARRSTDTQKNRSQPQYVGGSSATRGGLGTQARSSGRESGIDDWESTGAWSRIEDQIHRPVERPMSRLSIPVPGTLRISSPDSDSSSVEEQQSDSDDKGADDQSATGAGGVNNEDERDDEDHNSKDGAGTSDNSLAPDLIALRTKIDAVLAHYQTRQLNTRDHTPWEMMHAFVAFDTRTAIRRDGPNGPPVNAIGWILWGGRCRSQQLLTLERGRPHGEEGVGVQGHPAQLLAILAQSRVSANTPMRIGGKNFTLDDLIDEEMLNCRPDAEQTFKLISFAHYLESDAVWRSRDGQSWSIPRLINAEIKAPIRGAPCGGAHRLFGLTYAYQMRDREGRPVDGEFLRAKQYISSYQRYAWALQNPDGSFSTEWFARRGNRPDIDRKIQTSGHIAEWLALAMSDEQLREPRSVKAIDFIATSLANEPNRSWSIGPLGHALHALGMYYQRVFGDTGDLPRAESSSTDLTAADHFAPTDPTPDDVSIPIKARTSDEMPGDGTTARTGPALTFPAQRY